MTTHQSTDVTSDSRRAPRNSRVRDIVIYDDTETTHGQPARLADVSTFGLGFVQSTPMTLGQQFVLRLEMEEGRLMPLLFRVAYCRAMGPTAFRIGAALVRVINGNESFEINAETEEGIEFAEAFAEVISGETIAASYRMPMPEDHDTRGWAILVDSEEFAELVALSQRRDAERAGRRIAA
jgi:hypothetical protein